MVDNRWFGRVCGLLKSRWESPQPEPNRYGYVDEEPILKFCDHPNNPEDTEGNCRPDICPIGLKESK